MANIISGLTAILLGVGGILVLFWALNYAVERLSKKQEELLKPYVFIGPALVVVTVFLLYPSIVTFIDSFRTNVGTPEQAWTLDNYAYLLTDATLRGSFINNLIWILLVPAGAVAIGLLVAVLADRLAPTWEKVSKSLIFMPMAVSFVGASTIWMFIYTWRVPGEPQIGLLAAIFQGLGNPMTTPILQNSTFRLNTIALLVVMIWLQAGFAMVLLSAAIKNVPEDTIEAARIDGATEIQIFWRVTVPQIASTIVVVTTTILILVLKIFDIPRVMTSGNFNTNVIANVYFNLEFTARQTGRASVVVVALIVLTLPFMYINIKRFRAQEAMR
ncbi:MAG: sugar ABC transporter permease [Intrasporangiaceae bacterium]|nr:sugar ABC transporter permease [Intrasporangiaceae bacterium]